MTQILILVLNVMKNVITAKIATIPVYMVVLTLKETLNITVMYV